METNENDDILKKNKRKKNILVIGGTILFFIILNLYIGISDNNSNKKSESEIGDSDPINEEIVYSCNQSGAYDFAIDRIEGTIGRLHFLDFHSMVGNDWLFVGYVTSYEHNYDVNIELLVRCNSKESYFAIDANVY